MSTVSLSPPKHPRLETGPTVLWLSEFFCEFLDAFKLKFTNKYTNTISADLLIAHLAVTGFHGFIRLKFRYLYLSSMETKR